MKNDILYLKTLILEVYLIGYVNKGESIVFLLKADDHVSYAGVVDCYECYSTNKTIDILKKENVKKIDFLCWTHPHDDHTLGLNTILESYCDDETKIWITDIYPKNYNKYSQSSIQLYESIKTRIKNRNSKVKIATDNKILATFKCCGLKTYQFEICSFAPDSTILTERKEFEQSEEGNPYSIGLSIFAGRFNIMLGGDVENQTIDRFEEEYFDTPIDYIKIPHHGSSTGDKLPLKLSSFALKPPNVATSTIYKQHGLPEKQVLEKYKNWGTNEIYITSGLNNDENKEKYGVVLTSFDILEAREYPIETILYGNSKQLQLD